MDEDRLPTNFVRRAGDIALKLADTARLHREPEVAEHLHELAEDAYRRSWELERIDRVFGRPDERPSQSAGLPPASAEEPSPHSPVEAEPRPLLAKGGARRTSAG